ncbi:MAG TPA: hypothetical protein VGJ26_17335 [Pirellulales bacterium]|jgi:hypothetical protein
MADTISSLVCAQRRSKRPWYSLHRSTWVLLLPVAVALVLLMTPGAPGDYLTSDGYAIHFSQSYPREDSGFWVHGWPWQYLERRAKQTTFGELRDPAWLNPRAWWGSDAVREWNIGALCGNVAVAFGITLIVAAGLEWRRRRHSAILQFSIVELGCATAAVAVALAWWSSPVKEWRDEADSIAATRASGHDFRGNYLGPHWVRRLIGAELTKRWERVQYASLRGYDFRDASNHITAFKHLACVGINECRGVEVLADWISSLPEFEELYVETSDTSNEDLDVLLRTGKVSILEVRCQQVTDAGFANVAISKNLGHFIVRDASVSDQTLIQLGKLPNLKGLGLEYFRDSPVNVAISDPGVSYLSGASQLFRVDFSGAPITDEAVRSLAPCKELVQLYIERTRISGSGFDAWDGESKLEVLDLRESPVTDEGLTAIARLTKLQDLRLSRTLVGEGSLAALTPLRALEFLDLSETGVTDAGLASLTGLTNLRNLKLRNTKVTDAGLPQLAKMHSLLSLYLAETQITDAAVESLKSLTSLQYLDLKKCKLSKAAVDKLRAYLPKCDISYNPQVPKRMDETVEKMEESEEDQ